MTIGLHGDWQSCEALALFRAGHLPLATEVAARAGRLARRVYGELLSQEFSGELVQTYAIPAWLPPPDRLPIGQLLRDGGWRADPVNIDRSVLVSSADCEVHADYHGPTLLWILFNDSVRLRVEDRTVVPAAGELWVFDDTLEHCAIGDDQSTLLLAYSLPLARSPLVKQRCEIFDLETAGV